MDFRLGRLLMCFAVSVVACSARGQSAGPRAADPKTSDADRPVLIMHSPCPEPRLKEANAQASCETVIRKREFDSLIAAIDPNMPENNRLQLATEYIKLLVLGREAERLKLDQDPALTKLIEFTRLELLERQLVRSLEREACSTSAAEATSYYREHPTQFEEGSFLRLYIPKEGAWSSNEQAEAIRQRAASGGDFDKLQREVWAALGRPSGAPTTQTGTLRRSNLAQHLQVIFDLVPGETSSVISDESAYSVYRMLSKRMIPEEAAREEIRTLLRNDHVQGRITSLRDSVMVDVNEDYFGTLPATEELARHHGMEHHGSHLMPMSTPQKEQVKP